MKSVNGTLSDRLWQIRDEIAELRKERKKMVMDGPVMSDELEEFQIELAMVDARLDELAVEHEKIERARQALRESAGA